MFDLVLQRSKKANKMLTFQEPFYFSSWFLPKWYRHYHMVCVKAATVTQLVSKISVSAYLFFFIGQNWTNQWGFHILWLPCPSFLMCNLTKVKPNKAQLLYFWSKNLVDSFLVIQPILVHLFWLYLCGFVPICKVSEGHRTWNPLEMELLAFVGEY